MIPKISVVVPVYNVEKKVSQCLESLIHQTLKEIEIIVVNDGSTDSSEQICLSYAQRDNRIRLFSKQNGGLSDARNYGIDRASADVIGFVDSDDYIDENMYEYLLKIKEAEHAQIAVGGVKMTTDEGKVYQTRSIDQECVLTRHDAMKEVIFSRRILNSVCNKIFDTVLFEGIRFPKGKLYEDEYVTFRLFDKAEKVALTNEVYYYYRQNSQSITHLKFSDRELDRIYASIEKKRFLEKNYPDLVYLGEQYLVYDCMMALSKMRQYSHQYDILVYGNIKQYWKSFIKGDHSLGAKIYVLVARISPKLAVICNRLLWR